MARKKMQLKRFLKENPICCFCGGSRDATTMDHVPPRSLFIDRRHPKGLEFPACNLCNNTTASAEDAARLATIFQGTSFSEELFLYFQRNKHSLLTSMGLASIQLTELDRRFGEHDLFEIDEKTQEAIVTMSTKVALALYYRIKEKEILDRRRRIALTFYTAEKIDDRIFKTLDRFQGAPQEKSLLTESMARQFFYKFVDFRTQFDRDYVNGANLWVAFHFHQGLICFALFLSDEDKIKDWHQIIRSPFP